MKVAAGRFDDAIDALCEARSAVDLSKVAENVIDRECGTIGTADLSPETRRIALKAYSATLQIEQRKAASRSLQLHDFKSR